MNYIEEINNFEILDLIAKANKLSLKKGYDTISLERAIFLSWWCDKGDCSFCYMSTQKNKIKDPKKAKRKIEGILAEVELCKRLGWNIEFLSGGYDSFETQEIKSIANKIYEMTENKLWLNIGITEDLESYGEEIIGITGAAETTDPKLHVKICPSKSLDDIGNMLNKAKDLGFKRAITIILGLGETLQDIDYLIQYIKEYNVNRVIFYSLNPHKDTEFENSSQPASLYYSGVVATIRLTFPEIEIICGTWTDNLANIGPLILSGANGITKFPLFKMFGTKYGKRVEEEVYWAGRKLKGTFTKEKMLGSLNSKFDSDLDPFIKRYIKESMNNKY
ncbi:3-methylornithine synthase [Candidatus Methanobinarius endosymbioticus]|uniref:3-methylornithine synthase n=1 Tax=Candidatus Methanobinarius endosymbioticus TaxID=2006182 RepID=A0A366MBH7_9EURY|nr:3-methylornithine synthase [Candidatus Methanobinarius endosymbioticus]